MLDEDLSVQSLVDFDGREPGGLDLEGLWMRNRLLERIFGELEPLPRFGDRWKLRDTPTASLRSGLPVEDDRGARGQLKFLTKPPTPVHATRLFATIEQYACLDHEQLEPLLDWGVLDDRPWIVQPIENTRSMREWLHHDVESWTQVIEKFIGVCHALAGLHRHGLLHGELVPDMFFIDSRGRGRVGGTLEAAAQRLASRRPDNVSFASDQADLCMAIHGALLAIETQLVLEAPRWVVDVLERGFAERPADRWPSVDALADHLEHRLRMRARLVVLSGGAAA